MLILNNQALKPSLIKLCRPVMIAKVCSAMNFHGSGPFGRM